MKRFEPYYNKKKEAIASFEQKVVSCSRTSGKKPKEGVEPVAYFGRNKAPLYLEADLINILDNEKKITKNYKFGCRHPTEGLDVFEDQAYKGHRYGNKLVELENDRRQRENNFIYEYSPSLLDAKNECIRSKEQLNLLESEIKQIRSNIGFLKTNKKESFIEKFNQKLELEIIKYKELEKETKQRYRDFYKSFKEGKKKFKQMIKEGSDSDIYSRYLAHIQDVRQKKKTAQHESGLHFGGYHKVEDNKKSSLKSANPKFYRWKNEGFLALNIANGGMISSEDIFKKNSRAYMDPVDPNAWVKGTKNRTSLQYTKLHMKIGKPVDAWVTIPVRLHRPLPEDGAITWITVYRKVIADRVKFEVQFTVNSAKETRQLTTKKEMIGIDLGWRRLVDSTDGHKFRVAYWADNEGNSGEICLPFKVFEKNEHIKQLLSVQDKLLDQSKDKLNEIVLKHPGVLRVELSYKEKQAIELSDKTDKSITDKALTSQLLSLIKSSNTLSKIIIKNENNINDLSKDYYYFFFFKGKKYTKTVKTKEVKRGGKYSGWIHKNRHINQWISYLRDQIQNIRKDKYRQIASWIYNNYKHVAFEGDKKLGSSEYTAMNLTNFGKYANVTKKPKSYGTSGRAQQKLVSPGLFRLMIEEKNKLNTKYVDKNNTTKKCYKCNGFGETHNEIYTCGSCKSEHDRDLNASKNIMMLGLASAIAASPFEEGARKT